MNLSHHCESFQKFAEKLGSDDILSDIIEACYERVNSRTNNYPHVRVHDIYKHNVLNYTFSGQIEIGGEIFQFIINDGDWGGTEVVKWGEDVGMYKHPPIKIHLLEPDLSLINNEDELEAAKKSCNDPAMLETMGKYLYDAHFAPGCKTENYWRKHFTDKKVQINVRYEQDD